MARRSGRVTRGSRRGPKNQIWTAILADDVSILTGTTSLFAITQDSDWTRGQGQERATILRVRGWMSISARLGAGITGDGAVGALVQLESDLAVAPPNALLIASYVDTDILWTAGHQFPHAEGDMSLAAWDRDVDIKAMRKIRAGQRLSMVVTSNLTNTVSISLVLRALVRVGGN